MPAAGRRATSTGSSVRTRRSGRSSPTVTGRSPSSTPSASRCSTGRFPPKRLRSRCVSRFESVSEQQEAKRLLEAAIAEGPVHAYLLHGPAGVGKRKLARAFALELLGTTRPAHPDLYEL